MLTSTQKDQAFRAAWTYGRLNYLLRSYQLEIKQSWTISKQNSKRFVSHCGRQLGKSYLWLVVAIEECIKRPNTKVIFLSHVEGKTLEYVEPLLNTILAECPDDLKPDFKGKKKLLFANNSKILFYGTSNKSFQSIRGQNAHLIIIDEAGFISQLEAVMTMIMPAILINNGYLILSSNSPLTPDHYFNTLADELRAIGCYIRKTTFDNPFLTQKQKDDFAKEYCKITDIGGRQLTDEERIELGKQSTGYRRELLCENIVDSNLALCPEFNPIFHVKEFQPDEYYQHYRKLTVLDI